MKLEQVTDHVVLRREECSFAFLPTGDVFEFAFNQFMINQFQGNPIDGSINNIYLRVYTAEGIQVYPLLGISSGSQLKVGKDRLVYTGTAAEISYQVTFVPGQNGTWFWNIKLNGDGQTVDLVYGQDLGMAGKGGVLANELYMSQYLDHSIWEGSGGYAVCSRQNQPQGEVFPYLQQGLLGARAVGYATDATQFFGLGYKAAGTLPLALSGDLPSRNYQFELAYTALQSEKLQLNGVAELAFYGLFRPDHPQAVKALEFQQEIAAAYAAIDWNKSSQESLRKIEKVALRAEFGSPYASPQWLEDEIAAHYPVRKLAEYQDGQLLSFFTDDHVHVVLQPKELLTERPHGHIITTALKTDRVDTRLMTSTNYMYGIFNGQTLIGNTSFHKLLSTPRGLLNILKNAGQRIYVRIDGVYRILTLPAAYELGVHYARWHYTVGEDVLSVTAYAAAGQPDIVLAVESASGVAYDYLITNQLVMGEHEYLQPLHMTEQDGALHFTVDADSWGSRPYPGLSYTLEMPGTAYTWSDDRVFYEDGQPRNGTLLTLAVSGSAKFQLILRGSLAEDGQTADAAETADTASGQYDFTAEKDKFHRFYQELSSGFHLAVDGPEAEQIAKLNETAWWYTHNAMTHFIVPHGLEQPGGAAWGTRDVCQGPMEYFLMTQHYELARNVLLTIYSHQLWESREWPQWFMFDGHPVQAHEWHGDVVLWPLKCIGDYVMATGDSAILAEQVPYHRLADATPTEETETMLDHVKAAVATIEERFLYGTSLISYAGGDWDDTLQPADEDLKTKLVSAWTVALAYQAIRNLAQVVTMDAPFAAKLADMAERMGEAFRTLLIKDDVIAGFAFFRDNETIDYMLHPTDTATGIHYRLLPMTRSIIAELVDPEQAKANMALIDKHLKFPDGVRLMDRPARYDGGVSTIFRRAEQAANVGREISLQYVHAHIRYLEASAKLGDAKRVWEGLFTINPINIRESVPNAGLRQANTYFSSSDGDFPDRYSYQQDFAKLASGEVKVKGGWRLYSSGPGIYLNQLISNILGIRFGEDALVVDPVLPRSLDGLRFTYKCYGRSFTFVYHIGSDSRTDTAVVLKSGGRELAGKPVANAYRTGAMSFDKADILALADEELHVYMG